MGSVPGLNCSSSCGLWAVFESRQQEGKGGVGLKADLGRNQAARAVWTRSMKGEVSWLPLGRRSSVGCFPPCWKERSDLTNASLCMLVLHQGVEGWEKGAWLIPAFGLLWCRQ